MKKIKITLLSTLLISTISIITMPIVSCSTNSNKVDEEAPTDANLIVSSPEATQIKDSIAPALRKVGATGLVTEAINRQQFESIVGEYTKDETVQNKKDVWNSISNAFNFLSKGSKVNFENVVSKIVVTGSYPETPKNGIVTITLLLTDEYKNHADNLSFQATVGFCEMELSVTKPSQAVIDSSIAPVLRFKADLTNDPTQPINIIEIGRVWGTYTNDILNVPNFVIWTEISLRFSIKDSLNNNVSFSKVVKEIKITNKSFPLRPGQDAKVNVAIVLNAGYSVADEANLNFDVKLGKTSLT